jgi:hypothetical protein
LLALVGILAGCGGGGSTNWQQVQGEGFRFDVPPDWAVKGVVAADGAVDRVEVRVFPLERPYDPARRAAVGRELDHVASALASQLKGSVTSRAALEVSNRDARTYSIEYDEKTTEITFVLVGGSEYQLLCRRPRGGSDSACRELVSSFQLD